MFYPPTVECLVCANALKAKSRVAVDTFFASTGLGGRAAYSTSFACDGK